MGEPALRDGLLPDTERPRLMLPQGGEAPRVLAKGVDAQWKL